MSNKMIFRAKLLTFVITYTLLFGMDKMLLVRLMLTVAFTECR